MALGARAGDVQVLVVRQSLAVMVSGTLAGLVAAFGLTRLMSSLLYEVSATDPLTFAAVPLALVAVSLVASWLPALRASRVEPVRALSVEMKAVPLAWRLHSPAA